MEEDRIYFYENLIFNEFKDSTTYCNMIKRKYDGLPVDFASIYRRIVNYQIKTYGRQLRGNKKKYEKKYKGENYEKRKDKKKNMEILK